ncbi:hypothetical protein RY831_13970 [Noviherbaspirillum sp. CPCC 100848]|uniref:Uncharacterized protein n=1 Tax=Noviherbaspirillum album TaxID=3080276 RepID=A0ABU6J9D1_9BURK|nr:hypothetical protein [Noviherbaspirillum sp. CPCC 100848]MEC4720263.1 hypothetical protein [Noviherbaspirillum sp. CPCC 100848]
MTHIKNEKVSEPATGISPNSRQDNCAVQTLPDHKIHKKPRHDETVDFAVICTINEKQPNEKHPASSIHRSQAMVKSGMRRLTAKRDWLGYKIIILATMIFTNAYASERLNNKVQLSLWDAIYNLEQQMPLSKASIEKLLGTTLFEIEYDPNFIKLAGPGPTLRDGIILSKLNLMLESSPNLGNKRAFAMELRGTCVTIHDVRRNFGDVELAQIPRGKSRQETAVWTVKRSQWDISFGFKEEQPDCLFRISFRKP